MTRHAGFTRALLVGTAMLLGACGGSGKPAGPQASSAQEGNDDADAAMNPCGLATHEQVMAVLPDADTGSVTASGGSLVRGVDAYQCSYMHIVGNDANLLTVIVNAAADDAAWAELRPSDESFSDDRRVAVGDIAWVRGSASEMKVKVLKGHSMIDVELMSPDAEARTDALVELARIVASKVN